jgi:hypothetical protein|nr:hypothetical protein [Kofleriaceae bacterium]
MQEVETFHVYVVGSKDPTSEGLARVAEAIAMHYGIAADDLLGRLTRGRFRVKTGVDRATADQYHRDLDKLGARVAIEPASPADRSSGTSLPPPNKPRTTTPPPILPPRPDGAISAPSQRPTPLPAVPRTTTPPPSSGLAAAFSGEVHVQDLSAFDKMDNIALSSIDGVQDQPIESSQYSSASFGPAMDLAKPTPLPPPPTSRPSRPQNAPVEQDFRPPGADEEDMKMDVAPDELEYRARRRTPVSVQSMNTTATPVGPGAAGVPAPPLTNSLGSPMLAPKPRPSQGIAGAVVRPAGKLGPLGDERVRFAVGVVLALALGLVPAHLIAGSWEKSSYHSIDNRLEHEQETALESPEAYQTLDAARDHALADKKDTRRDVAIIGMLLWLAAAGGLGFVWFKRIPWDRFE